MQWLAYIKRVACLRALCQNIQLVWVDGGYRGEDLRHYVAKLWACIWQVVLGSEDEKGIKLLPGRWGVERTFAWILKVRRLSKDYEKNRRNTQSMVYLAMLPLMMNRLK